MVRKLLYICSIINCIAAILISSIELVKVFGSSMEPTLPNNSLVIGFKIFNNPILNPKNRLFKNYNVVKNKLIVFNNEFAEQYLIKKYYIKRCIGIPNDIIMFNNDEVFINNERLINMTSDNRNDHSLIPDNSGTINKPSSKSDGHNYLKCCFLHEDKFFVIGDNLDNSLDSRSFGPIPLESIICVGLFKIHGWRITRY